MQGVVGDDEQPRRDVRRRPIGVASRRAILPFQRGLVNPIFRKYQIPGQCQAINQQMGAPNEDQRIDRRGQQQKRQGVNRDMHKCWRPALCFLAGHPIRLRHIVAQQVQQQLFQRQPFQPRGVVYIGMIIATEC